MQISNNPNHHLTYCTNTHPAETWDDVQAQLQTFLPPLKKSLSPNSPFGVGLRLSYQAAKALQDVSRRQAFQQWLDAEGLHVLTINGFVSGDFYKTALKEQVYEPNWNTASRLDYTKVLFQLFAELLPEGISGSISTSPLAYAKTVAKQPKPQFFQQCLPPLLEVVNTLVSVDRHTGKCLNLSIEPEPDCLLSNTSEVVDFFENHLFLEGAKLLASQQACSRSHAELLLRKHITLCYDACHFAVKYESPQAVLSALDAAGIQLGKVQLSSALQGRFSGVGDSEKVARLQEFADPVYLHQVTAKYPQGTKEFCDLPEAIRSFDKRLPLEFRAHYHVPVFLENAGIWETTQSDLKALLLEIAKRQESQILEIETYTWSVLPPELKGSLLHSIEQEYLWVQQQQQPLRSVACHKDPVIS